VNIKQLFATILRVEELLTIREDVNVTTDVCVTPSETKSEVARLEYGVLKAGVTIDVYVFPPET